MNPPKGYCVEPVYATVDHTFRYAREFVRDFLGVRDCMSGDEPIDYAPGDIYFALDLNHHVPRVHHGQLTSMMRSGVNVYFVVYDLLPIQFPQFWEPQHSVEAVVNEWLSVVSRFSGVYCISKAVADEFSAWREKNMSELRQPFIIDWFHLGADVDNSVPSKGVPANGHKFLSYFRARPSFLMVGTVEPRKGHEQVLAAFEQLWKSGVDANLVIVGKQGWMMEGFIERFYSHREREKRLFWLEGISDEYLEEVYDACACLIAASYGEGFGLPLIEAAQNDLPIIARDIPVFREVAGEYAFYFDGLSPDSVAQTVAEWLLQYGKNAHPTTKGMPWLTWQESAKNLLEKVTSE